MYLALKLVHGKGVKLNGRHTDVICVDFRIDGNLMQINMYNLRLKLVSFRNEFNPLYTLVSLEFFVK